MKLYDLAAEFAAVANQLEADDAPPEVIADTLEGLAMPFEQKARNLAAYITNIEADAEAYEAHAKRLAAQAKAIRSKIDGMKGYLRLCMALGKIDAIKGDGGYPTIKLQRGRDSSVQIDDESAIPPLYLRLIPAHAEPDKTLIKQAIGQGVDVPGARVIKKDRLEIK